MRVWATRRTEYGCGYCERSEDLLTLDGLGIAILHGAGDEESKFIVDAANHYEAHMVELHGERNGDVQSSSLPESPSR